jgi:CBS-domain-containing membrane protein
MINCNALLSSLLVRDVMRPDVITTPASAELSQAAALMHGNQVNCLPVVDDQGRCVGVLTASDFVTRFAEHASSTRPLAGEAMSLTQCGPCHSLLLDETPQDYVRPRMSPAVQTVTKETPILTAARLMSGARLHHLIVLDNSCRPVGVISSWDIVAAMVRETPVSMAD